MKLDYCFHTHTYRCGHARGTDEAYVKEAINANIKELGFSDHVFLPGQNQPGIRGDYAEIDGYLKSINSLKEKYKNKINIRIGFEAEFFENYVEYYKSLKKLGIDYLVLGQHFLMHNDHITSFDYFNYKTKMKRYFEEVEKGVKSGLFTYLAHPDFFLLFSTSFGRKEKEMSKRICKLCKNYDMPIEINLNGMRRNPVATLTYPYEKFWKIAGEIGNKVVIGYDAHYHEFFREQNYVEKAFEYVNKYKLNLINKEDILKRIK